MNKRGSVPILVAMGAVPIVLFTGVFAIDAARFAIAKARLQSALDAAALTAARDINSANRDSNVRAVIAANYNGGAPNQANQTDPGNFQNITITSPSATQVQVQAEVQVKPLLSTLKIPGWFNPTGSVQVVKGSSTANRTNTGIELALVFDTTLSMALNDGTTDANGKKHARIEYAKQAALALTNILFGSQTVSQDNLYISIVPFNIAINIGNGATQQGWLAGTAPNYPTGYSWSGCVEARLNGYDAKEDAPNSTVADSMFRRYYWPSTYNASLISTNTAPRGSASNASCTIYQDYSNTVCTGNNDWTASTALQDTNPIVTRLRSLSSVYGTLESGQRVSTGSGPVFGPNFMCPSIAVLPLAMHRPTIETRIRSMVGTTTNPYPFGYGTVIATGLQGAWYTLSPSWQGMWPNPNPVVNGSQLTPPSPLPLAYGTPKMTKAVVLLSDGDNNWMNARDVLGQTDTSGTGSGNTLPRPESVRAEMFYNAYGTLSTTSNRLGITIPNASSPPAANSAQLATDTSTLRTRADAKLDAITRDLCTKMKAKGIVIYAVGVGVAEEAHHDLLEDCVSPPTVDSPTQKYIRTANATDLVGAFTQIANELANLRLSQ